MSDKPRDAVETTEHAAAQAEAAGRTMARPGPAADSTPPGLGGGIHPGLPGSDLPQPTPPQERLSGASGMPTNDQQPADELPARDDSGLQADKAEDQRP